MHNSVTKNIADQYAGKKCYLDGAPAIVCGRLNGFATIATLDGSRSIEYSWHTVNRVMRYSYGFFETK